MHKFVPISFTRHRELLDIEKTIKSMGTIKQASDALIKNQQTQDFLQRKQEYKEKEEEIPKTLQKEIPKKAVTYLPPPSNTKKIKRKKFESFGKNIGTSGKLVFPLNKKFHDVQKRKPKEKKVPTKVTGLNNWQFIREEI